MCRLSGVEPQAVDAHLQPTVHDLQQGPPHARVIEIQIGLVAVETVPIVGPRLRIPGPIRRLEVLEDDARLLVAVGGVAPNVEIAPRAIGPGAPRALEPTVLVGSVVQHQLGDHAQAPLVRLAQKRLEIAQRTVDRVDVGVVGDVVAIVEQGRRIEREQPESGHTQVLQIVELLGQPLKIADPVSVGVVERAHGELVDDRVLVPRRIGSARPGSAVIHVVSSLFR